MLRPQFDIRRLPRKALFVIPAVLVFIAALGYALASGSGGKSTSSDSGASASAGLDVAPTAAPAATPSASATPVLANRANCSQIQGTDYQSSAERDWYEANCLGKTPTPSSTTTATTQEAASRPASAPAPAAPVAPGSYVSGKAPGPVADELMLRRLGVDGPVHTSVVGSDGAMGNPDGKDDIVWYDFSAFPGYGGYPGMGGNAVFAGHVDYHPHYLAVFWYLRDAVPGDIIDYYTASGQHLQYTVQWNINTGPDDDYSQYVAQTGEDIMTLITCDGVFNPDTGHYDHRSVIRAKRTS